MWRQSNAALKKQEGVQAAVVNLSSERATVTFDPSAAGLPGLVARVAHTGYGVATGEADLVIKRLADDNDARRLEKTLAKLEGVLEVSVSIDHRTGTGEVRADGGEPSRDTGSNRPLRF